MLILWHIFQKYYSHRTGTNHTIHSLCSLCTWRSWKCTSCRVEISCSIPRGFRGHIWQHWLLGCNQEAWVVVQIVNCHRKGCFNFAEFREGLERLSEGSDQPTEDKKAKHPCQYSCPWSCMYYISLDHRDRKIYFYISVLEISWGNGQKIRKKSNCRPFNQEQEDGPYGSQRWFGWWEPWWQHHGKRKASTRTARASIDKMSTMWAWKVLQDIEDWRSRKSHMGPASCMVYCTGMYHPDF